MRTYSGSFRILCWRPARSASIFSRAATFLFPIVVFDRAMCGEGLMVVKLLTSDKKNWFLSMKKFKIIVIGIVILSRGYMRVLWVLIAHPL